MADASASQPEGREPSDELESVASDDGNVELDGLARDVACPNCEYNLRGLPGDPVTCPECGKSFSVTKLLETRWNKPWYRAPGFTLATGPVIGLAAGIVAAYVIGGLGQAGFAVPFLSILWPAVWVLCIAAGFLLTQRVIPGKKGVLVGFASLVSLVGYFAAVFLLFYTLVVILYFERSAGTGHLAIGLVAAPVGIVCGVIGRRSEKWIAAQCIKEHLRRKMSPRD